MPGVNNNYTYSAHKAVVMPNVTQGLQELVSSLNGELTAVTSSSKQIVEVLSPETESHDTHNICYGSSPPLLFITSMHFSFSNL